MEKNKTEFETSNIVKLYSGEVHVEVFIIQPFSILQCLLEIIVPKVIPN